MQTRHVLTHDEARRLMAAAVGEAQRRQLAVSIAVVDEHGVLLLLERLDGARYHTPEAATLKARTAAITRSSTATLEQQVRDDPATLSFPGRMPLAGGMPLLHGGEVVGAVGSSGAQPDEDQAVCEAALAAMTALVAALAPALAATSTASP